MPRQKEVSQILDSVFFGREALVTGGLGFIGSNLARRLALLGARVTIVDSLIPEYGGNLFNIREFVDRVTVNISDVRDEHSMKYLVRGKEFLFNLAGQTSHMDSMKNPRTDLEINCKAQLSILEACRHHAPEVRIVFASTRQMYGRPERLPVDETHPIRPVDVNGINKLAGESYHLLYSEVYGVRACALRLTNTFGPGMRVKDARQTFLGAWIRAVVDGERFEVWGGEQKRDYTFVDDVVEAFLLAAATERCVGKAYNVGGFAPLTLLETASRLVAAAGEGSYVVCEFPADRKKIDIGDYYSDDSMFRTETGWAPTVDIDEALARTIEYYRRNMAHYR